MAREYHHGAFSDDARRIRKAVFMDEQGFQNEFEPLDDDAATMHVALVEDGRAVGCTRLFPVPAPADQDRLGCPFLPPAYRDGTDGDVRPWVFGRLAVLPEMRGGGRGTGLLAASEAFAREAGATEMHLHAQYDKKPFYEKAGYAAYGEVEMDEHVPHVWMSKQL
ncbi:GNAT family N-acetyltransferase [Eggerthellaceae bacterium zg-893]|nr:GNAT family N-acetyltransferase [Eggerthellaceae bacterium zg-893]